MAEIEIKIDGDVSSDYRDYVTSYTTATGAAFKFSGHLAKALTCMEAAAYERGQAEMREKAAGVCQTWADAVRAKAPRSPAITQAEMHADAIRRTAAGQTGCSTEKGDLPMKLTDEQIATIRDGTEGVTPGPWAYVPDHFSDGSIKRRSVCVERSKYDWIDLISDLNNALDAAHIARCDPGTIRDMATELLEARAENDRMRGVLDKSYSTLAAAFNRIHGLPRTSDTELAKLIETTRAKIERARAALKGERDEAVWHEGKTFRECQATLANLDEDRLTEIITDSIDLDWTPRDAAKAIVRATKRDAT